MIQPYERLAYPGDILIIINYDNSALGSPLPGAHSRPFYPDEDPGSIADNIIIPSPEKSGFQFKLPELIYQAHFSLLSGVKSQHLA